MQLLVFAFIAVVGLAAGAAAYIGFTFTLIESVLVAAVVFALCMLVMERTLRQRAEQRMEKAIDDLSRLLSTDAQAGQVLSQRINVLTDVNPGTRLNVLEADLSVLGTVVRQVAEAVSDLESLAQTGGEPQAPEPAPNPKAEDQAPTEQERESEPVIPLEMLRLALDEGRLIFHMRPVITLPHRRAQGYDVVPRLSLEDGELADTPDFMPRRGGQDLVRRIERAGIEEAVTIVRRARISGQPATLYVPVSRAILGDRSSIEELVGLFDASRVVSASLVLRMNDREWRAMTKTERVALAEFHAKGICFALSRAKTLRIDFNEYAALGVTSIRVDAEQFANAPASLTDFHSADISAYIARFGIDLVVENVKNEQQILTALEDGIAFAQGPHIALPAAVRADLMVRREAPAPAQTPAQRAASGQLS